MSLAPPATIDASRANRAVYVTEDASLPIDRRTFDLINQSASEFLRPPERLTVSQWADRFRFLSPESCAEPGPWESDRAPYLREVMDVFTDPDVSDIVMMTGAQVGKSESINNCAGYAIAQDPGPILWIQPTVEMAEAYSKERFAPMVRDTPALRFKVADVKSRDKGNTILHKTFPGGHLSFAGANSPAGLAMRSIRYLFCDEVDRYPLSAATEGDPISLARKRTATFWNRRLFYSSTPTIEGISRIQKLYLLSDQREYFVPCPFCGEFQTLRWSQIEWMKDPDHRPETAGYKCLKCGKRIDNRQKDAMLAGGEWRAAKPFRGRAGFRISELYSPWVSWGDVAATFLEAKRGGPEQLKSWTNTALGDTWKDITESLDDGTLYGRREIYPTHPDGAHILPDHVLVLTAGVDVQDTYIMVGVDGWGAGEECWGAEWVRVNGKAEDPRTWAEVDAVLNRTYSTASGVKHKIAAVFVDSGFATQQVYRFVKPRQVRRIYASKGISGQAKPAVGKPSRNNRQRVQLWPLGVDTIKDVFFARLRMTDFGPGFCHFPRSADGGDWAGYDRDYFEQLTAEEVKIKYQKGFPIRFYLKMRPRNEALDCRVYSYAALLTLSPDPGGMLERLGVKMEKKIEQLEKEKEETGTVTAADVKQETQAADDKDKKKHRRRRFRVNNPYRGFRI